MHPTPLHGHVHRRDVLTGFARRLQAPSADAGVVALHGALELAFVSAYQQVLARGALGPVETRLVTTFAGHHLGHAAQLQTLLRTLDRAAPDLAADAALTAELGAFVEVAAGRTGLLEVSYAIESVAAASAIVAVERVVERSSVHLAAEIAPVEAQHAFVLASVLGRHPGESLPDFETTTAQRLGG